jgi:hypothetical protein
VPPWLLALAHPRRTAVNADGRASVPPGRAGTTVAAEGRPGPREREGHPSSTCVLGLCESWTGKIDPSVVISSCRGQPRVRT